MTDIKTFYNTLGTYTKLIIKTSLIFSVTFSLFGLFSHYADFTPFHYKLLLITDELFVTARTFLSLGFVGALIFNYIEKKE